MNSSRTANSRKLYLVVVAAVLIAIGILIPMTFPKVYIPPMSFTLASHVAIFIGIFISPFVACAVAVGTTVGFLLSGLPIDVWLRAASHIIFTLAGSLWLYRHPDTIKTLGRAIVFGVILSVIHALGELAVVIPLYYGNLLKAEVYESSFAKVIVGLVGGGTFVHSLVDFAIAWVVWKGIKHAGGRLFGKT